MKKFIDEFKAFALKGNVMDMAVGMMVGAAFGKIVTSLVNDILMPLISCVFRADFTSLKVLLVDTGVEETMVWFNYGNFIQTVVDFLIVALCIFAMVKAINSLKKEEPAPAPEEPKPSDELVALNKIVSLLEEKK